MIKPMPKKRKYNRAIILAHNLDRMEYLGSLLKQYRWDTMLSREDFAKEYGVSKCLVERIEGGKNITLHSLLRILDIYMVSPEEVFMGVE